MARNPTRTGWGSRLGGGCLMVFSLPFIGVGGGIFIASLLGRMSLDGASPDFPAMVFGACFGSVFFGVGLVVFWAGLRQLLGYSNASTGGTMVPGGAMPPGWRRGDHEWKHPHFPPGPRRRRRARHGGIVLSTSGGARSMFWFLLVFAVFWNGIVATALISSLSQSETPDRGALIWIGIFLLVGIGLLVGAGYAAVRLFITGKTWCEVSAEPVAPGDEVVVFVHQPGNYAIERSTIRLICREKATYRQGTDTVTKTSEVWSNVLLDEPGQAVSASHGVAEVRFRVPAEAMHSFKASKNEIEWGVNLKLEIAGLPDVDEFFVFRVAPDNGPAGGAR